MGSSTLLLPSGLLRFSRYVILLPSLHFMTSRKIRPLLSRPSPTIKHKRVAYLTSVESYHCLKRILLHFKKGTVAPLLPKWKVRKVLASLFGIPVHFNHLVHLISTSKSLRFRTLMTKTASFASTEVQFREIFGALGYKKFKWDVWETLVPWNGSW